MKRTLIIHMPMLRDLIGWTFRVVFVWYIIAALLEALLPGFVTLSIDLDLFLWSVIVIGVLHYVINTNSR